MRRPALLLVVLAVTGCGGSKPWPDRAAAWDDKMLHAVRTLQRLGREFDYSRIQRDQHAVDEAKDALSTLGECSSS